MYNPATTNTIKEQVEQFLSEWDRHAWMQDNGEWASEAWQYQREQYDSAVDELTDELRNGDSIHDDAIESILDSMRHLEKCLKKLEGQVAPNDGDYIAEGSIDPYELEESLKTELPLASVSLDRWNCRAGWDAYKFGEALVLNWWRHGWGGRKSRDLWVIVDEAYFASEELGEVEIDD